MYLGRMSCKISIRSEAANKTYVLRGVNDIEIKKSVHQILQTAKLQLPLSVVLRNKELLERIQLSSKIAEGDKIKIEFGYDDKNNVEFEGYINRINYKTPLEVECEDEVYILRKVKYKNSFRTITLKALMTYVLDELYKQKGVRWELYDKMPEFTFTNFKMQDVIGVDVLQHLQEKYGLASFLTTINGKKVLYVGLMYGMKTGEVKYLLDGNTISTDDLKYQGADQDKKYKVKIVNFNRSGQKLTIETGDKDGEERTFYFYGNHTEVELKHMAQAELEKQNTLGYKGTFTTFLFPYSEPGMIAKLSNRQFPERKGNYYIGTVTTTFGTGGARRKPEIDFRTS